MYAFNFVPFFCNLEWGIHPTGSKGFVLIQQHIVLGAPSPPHPPPLPLTRGKYTFIFLSSSEDWDNWDVTMSATHEARQHTGEYEEPHVDDPDFIVSVGHGLACG